MRTRGNLACGAALAALCVANPLSAQPDSKPDPRTRGFLVSYFMPSMMTAGKDTCPHGLSPDPKEMYLAGLAPKEREAAKLFPTQKLYDLSSRSKDGVDLCGDPNAGPDPGFRTVEGNGNAPGMNLDGAKPGETAPGTCAHEKFAGGVDNQLLRAMGCVAGYQADDQFESAHLFSLRDGSMTYLIEITGLDNAQNDDDVQVGFYASPDRPPYAATSAKDTTSSRGQPLRHASFDVTAEAKYRQVLKGRIKDGVLTTDPMELRLPHVYRPFIDTDYVIHAARLRAEIQPDGSLKGMVAGYYDLTWFYDVVGTLEGRPHGTSNPRNLDISYNFHCAGMYHALHRLADGNPDPATGTCTSLSAAFPLEAVPAFVIHPEEAAPKQTADTSAPR
jgi:hypothetical protein